ncbi:MAG: hypothetical protein ACYCZR_09130 [Burkholderiales bacterium]
MSDREKSSETDVQVGATDQVICKIAEWFVEEVMETGLMPMREVTRTQFLETGR